MAVARISLVLMIVATVAWPGQALAASRHRYERAQAQERQLRLDGPRPSPLSQIRRTIAAYELIARRYPSSGYADNALFQAATLARAAHRVYGSNVDRDQALRLLQWLVREYPSSSLRVKAQTLLKSGATTRLARTSPAAPSLLSASLTAPNGPPHPDPAPKPGGAGPTSAERGSAGASVPGLVSLRDVKREVIGAVVRITLVFDGEVSYHQQELANPSRLYFDLDRTTPTPALQDATLSFEGPTGRHIRLGRPKGQTTRVVIDTQGARSYSVFALYNPYRLAIDMAPSSAIAPARTQLAARAVTPPIVNHVPVSAPTASLKPPTPERLAPTPLPHPLADRPALLPRAAPTRNVRAALRPLPLVARSLPNMRATLGPRVTARSVSVGVHQFLAAERARIATPLARKSAPPPSLPAPASPAPNSLGGFSLARQLGLGVSRIVIDPGHGGHDPGAMAQRTSEAEVVLDVALRLEKLLEREPGVEVILTRRTNVFIPLEERPAIANREGADLFLSIHVNSSRNTRATGVETYFLNFANNAEAEAVAARENATAARSMHQLPDMVKAISQNNKLDESRDFARTVQEALVSGYDRDQRDTSDRGVKHAPFVVLIGANMPSVLAEIAFITNTDEGGRLRSGAYRQQIAQSLFEALRKYQRSLKGVGTVASQ
jgi:N-acetylmuramoyl-L-alanine amidase